jgi:hypothetical protein
VRISYQLPAPSCQHTNSWKPEAGSWKLEAGSWKLKTGS